MTLLLPSPVECGMPSKFEAWRRRQDEAIVRAMESERRIAALCMPTGSGKSLTYMAAAALTGYRTAVLTSTKGLQEQLMRDFAEIGLVDVRGMGNYECRKIKEEETLTFIGGVNRETPAMCDIGPCIAGADCGYRDDGGCGYYDAVRVASRSPLIITNYAYWLHSRQDRLGKFDMLVLDEAHDAAEALGSYLSVSVTRNQTAALGLDFPREHDDWNEWKRWASECGAAAKRNAASLESLLRKGIATRTQARQYKEMTRIVEGMARVAESKDEWVSHISRRGDRGLLVLTFDPVWPGKYAERHLFRGIGKILLTSATLRPKTLGLLNIAPDAYDFAEYPSSFPIERRPVYWLPTTRVDSRSDPGNMRIWIAKIDNIIRNRLDRKGIIHTVSYARRDFILRHSEFASRMMTHETATAQATVERFKKAPAGTMLVSPSMATGWDFPYDECRYQIICKIPFPDTRDKIIKARSKVDPEYPYYLAMQVLQQASGRGMRSEDDACETFIIDDHASWFMGKYGRKLAADWFMRGYKKYGSGVPEPIRI